MTEFEVATKRKENGWWWVVVSFWHLAFLALAFASLAFGIWHLAFGIGMVASWLLASVEIHTCVNAGITSDANKSIPSPTEKNSCERTDFNQKIFPILSNKTQTHSRVHL